jgi:aspartate kinase
MKVFKFGGASVKDAAAVLNVALILKRYSHDNLLVVVSAMGKMTNAHEKLLNSFFYRKDSVKEDFDFIRKYHIDILNHLFADKNHAVYTDTENLLNELKEYIEKEPSDNYDFEYGQIVPYGELLSTLLVSSYLNETGIKNRLFDARDLIITNNHYRDAEVNWDLTGQNINDTVKSYLSGKQKGKIALTQGFIASTVDFHSTTLGREGSDYTAAIFAYALDAEEVVIWKDVPGILNADPKYFSETKKLDSISYTEAIELSYYGATIIHPKTIKPLENKNISLYVKSFLDHENEGSIVHENMDNDSLIPSFIFKKEQVLLSISPRDFSFICEKNLSYIFCVFAKADSKINLMQNSAISFTVCLDFDEHSFSQLITELQRDYRITFNTGLELITIRHYDSETINKILKNKKVLLEQRSRATAQFVVR